MSERIVFYCAPDLTVGDICAVFDGQTNVYDYQIAYDPDSGSVVIREGR